MTGREGYGGDLAYVHDAGFGDFADEAAPWLLALLRRSVPRGGLVVDLGCGSGRWARHLTDAGYEVLGIDQSSALLSMARARAPKATFRRGSIFGLTLPPCEAVTALGEVFNYRFDERSGARALSRLFRRVHAALRPGGVLVFDAALPGRAPPGSPQRGHRAAEDWAILFEKEENRARRLLTRSITTFRRVGQAYRRTEEVHLQRLYPRSEIVRSLGRAGFSVRTTRAYGRLHFPPGLAGFVARKARASSHPARAG